MQQGYDETGWDIMSGTAIETPKAQEIVISASGMDKLEFDELICLFSTNLELHGWQKVFSGLKPNGDYECGFRLKK